VRVKSLFNASDGCNFDLVADIEFPETWWIGVIIGPSGSGKTSLGKKIFGDDKIINLDDGWDSGKPVIDDIPGGFDKACSAQSSVGLGQRSLVAASVCRIEQR
jgi:hypothetical protein